MLELGGSDPYVVLADADITTAAQICAKARMVNGGQSCIAAKRFIVVEDVADEFEAELGRQLASLKVGDPVDRDTDVGPLAREDLVDTLCRQVDESVEQGARQLSGGRIDSEGCYYAPALLTGVTPDMPAFREELFGPVAPVIRARGHRGCNCARQRFRVRPGWCYFLVGYGYGVAFGGG
ncbi:MAG: aldehyde dehydrogenase family protein [Gammaproteobacteria bacterium]|nr:aldehyde dehydrogenase family protein [Gammaproteobacteria bacterium]